MIKVFFVKLIINFKKNLINAIPVHSISNVCYAKEAENSHIVVFQSGMLLKINLFLYQIDDLYSIR